MFGLSLNRLFRYIAGLLIAWGLIYFLVPFAGIAKSKFLPPSSVYANAQGKTIGYVTNVWDNVTNNPFVAPGGITPCSTYRHTVHKWSSSCTGKDLKRPW